jgi:hypothetical protein
MTTRDDPLAKELGELPVPPLDPALAADVQRRARAALAEHAAPISGWHALVLGWRAAAMPALLLLAGAFYVVSAFRLMLRIYVS